jgi:hypothetical protein
VLDKLAKGLTLDMERDGNTPLAIYDCCLSRSTKRKSSTRFDGPPLKTALCRMLTGPAAVGLRHADCRSPQELRSSG